MKASRLFFFVLVFLLGCIANPPIATNPAPAAPPKIGPGSCSLGKDWCMGQCKSQIDYVNDNANCGRCGNQCAYNQACTGGFCQCAPGYDSCMGQCKSSSDYISDNSNCGRCGNSCGIGESCMGGTCRKF